MIPIYLERREPAQNRLRFYTILVTRTLFGSWAMVREWGRIGHPGTVREKWFATEAEADAAGEQWRKWKERRGYRIIERRQENQHDRTYRCPNTDLHIAKPI